MVMLIEIGNSVLLTQSAGATATDASGDVTVVISGISRYICCRNIYINLSSTDASGNAGTATRNVTVSDTTAPVVTVNWCMLIEIGTRWNIY